MSGAEYFDDTYAINAYMDNRVSVNRSLAAKEHQQIKMALENSGVRVIQVSAPIACQDGVYTANWGLCRDGKVVLSNLPNKRQAEQPYAESILKAQGKKIIKLPSDVRFSGQGDALPCGNWLFIGSNYRTDREAHKLVGEALGYEIIELQTVPLRRWFGLGPIATNKVTGWPDSFFYDLDLALAVIRIPEAHQKGLIAWCPQAFTPESCAKIQALPIDKIEVSIKEAKHAYACNLISTGEKVIMTSHAPHLKQALENCGMQVLILDIQELAKGGGFIRCVSLTLDNR